MEVFTVTLRDRKNGLHTITGVVAKGRDGAITRALEIAKNEGLGVDAASNLQIQQVQPEGVSF